MRRITCPERSDWRETAEADGKLTDIKATKLR